MVQPRWKTVWRFLKKLKIILPYYPAIPFLGIYPKEMKSKPQRDIISHLLEWLLPKKQEISVGEDVEKGNPHALLVGM